MAAPCQAFLSRVSARFVSLAVARGSIRARLPPPILPLRCSRLHSTQPGTSSRLPAEAGPPRGHPWALVGAVCLERYPVVSQDLGAVEAEYGGMLEAAELECSLLSDHEIRLEEDKEKMLKRQSGALDDDEEDGELVSALDREDQYTEEFNRFTPASRTSGTDNMQSLQRRLMDKLVLLVKCRVGDRSLWMMPQGTRQDGESMRQVVDRVLVSQCGLAEMWRARVLGNAPSACFKYVYPPDVQQGTQHRGAKIFFYKARLLSGEVKIDGGVTEDHAWVRPSELDQFLLPSYLQTVRKFVVPVQGSR